MDCNSYSYVNMSSKCGEMALYDGDNKLIILEHIVDWFQENYYTVSDLYGNTCEDFEDLEQAKAFYNTLVPASYKIA